MRCKIKSQCIGSDKNHNNTVIPSTPRHLILCILLLVKQHFRNDECHETRWCSIAYLDWLIVAVSLVTSYFKEFLLRDQKAIAFAEPAHQQLLVSDLDSNYWIGTCSCLERITLPHISNQLILVNLKVKNLLFYPCDR